MHNKKSERISKNVFLIAGTRRGRLQRWSVHTGRTISTIAFELSLHFKYAVLKMILIVLPAAAALFSACHTGFITGAARSTTLQSSLPAFTAADAKAVAAKAAINNTVQEDEAETVYHPGFPDLLKTIP